MDNGSRQRVTYRSRPSSRPAERDCNVSCSRPTGGRRSVANKWRLGMRRHIRRPLLLLALMAVLVLPAAPTIRAQTAAEPIWGFADLHNHMFANLGFGGLAIWGKPFVEDDDMAKALPWSDFLVTGPGGGVVVEP